MKRSSARFSYESLEVLLRLPGGVKIDAAREDVESRSILIRFTGMGDEVPSGEPLTTADALVSVKTVCMVDWSSLMEGM